MIKIVKARIRGSKPVGPGLNQAETNFEILGPDQHQKFENPGPILAVRESLRVQCRTNELGTV